ncbi:hypothetical protein J3F84DRAFT_386169 [Trichoderma pleuroticola]
MDRLGPRAAQQTADGMLPLETIEVVELRLGQQTTGRVAAADTDETSIYDDITMGQARIMMGNVGIDNWRKVAGRKTTIAHNKFGGGVRIMTGDQGGQAAAGFNENFWN